MNEIFGSWTEERSEKIRISSKKAQLILDNHNTRNRAFVQYTIEIIEKALKEGKWVCNGETIIFSKEGILLDGQNRLYACASSGIPMTTWVVFGQNPDSFMTIDRGRNRNLASDLSIYGEHNNKALAAVLQVVCAYLDGDRSSNLIRSKYDTHVALKILNENPKIRESVTFSESAKRKVECPARLIGSVHYIAGKTDNIRVIEKRNEFFERLTDGVGLSVNSPILVVRNKFYQMMNNPDVRIKKGMGALSNFVYLHHLVRSWNMFLMGHTTSKLQLMYSDEARRVLVDIPDIRSYFRKPNEGNIKDE